MKSTVKTSLIVLKILVIASIAVLCAWKCLQGSAAVEYETEQTLPEITSESSSPQIVHENVPEEKPDQSSIDRVVRLKGSPEALGTQHGKKLKNLLICFLRCYNLD